MVNSSIDVKYAFNMLESGREVTFINSTLKAGRINFDKDFESAIDCHINVGSGDNILLKNNCEYEDL